MSMTDWARREVEIACKRENPDRKDGEFDYGCACYESALKAYESLAEDNHSGMSWSITKLILERLMDGKPLTPVTGDDDEWKLVEWLSDSLGEKVYQNKRMSSLFMHVMEDGSVFYQDIDRVSFIEEGSRTRWHNGIASQIVDDMFPITMPYFPEDRPYLVIGKEYLTDRKNGDFDTVAYKEVKAPDGIVHPIHQYYGEVDGEWRQLTKIEFMDRVAAHNKRIAEEEREKK